MKRVEAFEAVEIELAKAHTKFPAFNSSHEGYGIIKEEFDELWDEIKANRPNRAKEEAIQVAAMAIRYLIDISD